MNLWDRQNVDSDESFLWFVAYRDALPPRRLDRVRVSVPGKTAPTLQTLLNWFNDGCWADRAKAWDEHLDALRQHEKEQIVRVSAKESSARDQALIHEARELVSRELDKMLRTSMQSDAETLRPGELNKLMENVIKLGRLTRGESTENTHEEIDLSGLDLDDLRKIRELQEKARKDHKP